MLEIKHGIQAPICKKAKKWPFKEMKLLDYIDVPMTDEYKNAAKNAHSYGHEYGMKFKTQIAADEVGVKFTRIWRIE